MKLSELLMEDRVDYLAQNFGDQLVSQYKKDTQQEVEARTVVNELMKADPTQQSSHIQWLARLYSQGGFSISDISHVKHELAEFERVKMKLDKKDLHQYQSLNELTQATAPLSHEGDNDGSNTNRNRMLSQSDEIFKSAMYTIVSPRTLAAAKYFGRGTSWSIAKKEGNDFDAQHTKSPIYILMDRRGNKLQMSFALQKNLQNGPTIIDAYNNPVSIAEVMSRYQGIEKVLSDKTTFKDWTNAGDANIAIWYATNVVGGRWTEGEKTIMNNASAAVQYAAHIIRDRWADAEPTIMRDPWAAIEYCTHILDERWPAAESTIMKRSDTALAYAQQVIQGRWPEAEKVIKSHPHDAEIYQKHILKGAEWPDDIDTSRHKGSVGDKSK